jgi:hypothetical protein
MRAALLYAGRRAIVATEKARGMSISCFGEHFFIDRFPAT